MERLIKQPKLSEIIQAQLEALILDGTLRPGEQLAPERELAKQFDVSRPSLREAIQKLEAKGLVTRKQGGGTFVTDNMMKSLSDPLLDLLAKTPDSQSDILEFRLGLEGMAAYYAASRGSDADYQQIQRKFEAIELAQVDNDIDQEAKAVYEFLFAICQASHNSVFLHLVRSMADLLVEHLTAHLALLTKQPEAFDKVRLYRKRLTNAILNGKAQKAWGESHNHLMYIEDVLLQHSLMNNSLQRAMHARRPVRRF